MVKSQTKQEIEEEFANDMRDWVVARTFTRKGEKTIEALQPDGEFGTGAPEIFRGRKAAIEPTNLCSDNTDDPEDVGRVHYIQCTRDLLDNLRERWTK